MTTGIRLALILLVIVLLIGAGAWFYLFGPNAVAAADLVPSDTLVFATIPNAARLVVDYQSSKLKTLLDQPEAKPTLDTLSHLLGPKNLQLLQDFLQQLSGQSFIAITHYDPANPAAVGLIAGLHPKPGVSTNFDDFVTEVKNAYPDVIAQGTTGAGNVEGLDYQWIKGPTAADKICVARHNGWIITSWGEDSLRDWWERYQKKSATPSLAQNVDYRKSLLRVGLNSETLFYVDYHRVMPLAGDFLGGAVIHSRSPGYPLVANPFNNSFFTNRTKDFGAFAVGSKFENGEIADHFSLLIPRETQTKMGMPASPCPFETLNFTGTDTFFYYGAYANFEQSWKNLQELPTPPPWMQTLQNWAQSHNLDVQRNIIGPLGHEMSVQAEWASDSSYPEAGLFVKLDKPDDFKPTITAIIDTVRQTYINSASISEINSDGRNFAALKFVQSLPITPTITEDGPYLGVFLRENQAVRSFRRDPSLTVTTNSDFQRQIGSRQKEASQMLFLDSPRLLDRGYDTARPYLPVAAMFNPLLSSLIRNQNLPPDVHWLDPVGTWSFTSSVDNDGVKLYSVSGIGNQGVFLSVGAGMVYSAVQPLLHRQPPAPIQESLGASPLNATPAPNVSPAPINPPMAPAPATNAAPATLPVFPPATGTNAAPVPASTTPPAPAAATNTPPSTNAATPAQ